MNVSSPYFGSNGNLSNWYLNAGFLIPFIVGVLGLVAARGEEK
jgi:hypothetical protein